MFKTRKLKTLGSRKAQCSTVEYMVLFGIIIVTILIFAAPGGFFSRQLTNVNDINIESMERMTNLIFNTM